VRNRNSKSKLLHNTIDALREQEIYELTNFIEHLSAQLSGANPKVAKKLSSRTDVS
jgi:hypothetical protein